MPIELGSAPLFLQMIDLFAGESSNDASTTESDEAAYLPQQEIVKGNICVSGRATNVKLHKLAG
jgi:hypothetical protein